MIWIRNQATRGYWPISHSGYCWPISHSGYRWPISHTGYCWPILHSGYCCPMFRRLSVVCPSINRDWDFNQHSEEPQTRSDHRRIVTAIQEYDTTVDLVIFVCSNFREFLILGLFTVSQSLEFFIYL